jgi:hypothetical protein
MSTAIQTVSASDTKISPKRIARIAGVLYLLVGIFSGFAYGYVISKIYASGDAAATAGNVVANAGLVRAGVIADLAQATLTVFLAMTLYLLLEHVSKNAARAMVILAVIAATIMCLNDVFEFASLLVATNANYVTAFGVAGSNALALLLLDIQHFGYLIAQIFFGLWLAPMGYLAYKSGLFPKALGVVLVAATICYLLDMLAAFLVPDVSKQIHPLLVIVPTIAEPWMVLYLLIFGVRSPRSGARASAGQTPASA